MSVIAVVMGVSGCGKSTVAEALADLIGAVYLDADDYHPESNKKKLSSGIPLTDDDRWGWYDTLRELLIEKSKNGKPVVMACSALRQVYRERLTAGLNGVKFLYLKGSKDVIRERIEARKGHFMPASLLDSQFATLEEPTDAIDLDVRKSVAEITSDALAVLKL